MKYNLHQINTNKFKTNLIAIFLSTELTRENVTKNAVLSSVLRRGSKNLKTQEEISKRLEEMYGAEFNCGLDKIGKNHVLKFYVESVNNEFLPQGEENMLKSSIEILTEIILNPLVENNKFNVEYVKQEKENIKQIIEAKKDNKAKYATFRCMEEMYKDKPEGLYKYGYTQDLERIDETSLYEYYKELISECKIDIFVSGNLENEEVKKIVSENEYIKKLKDREERYVINKVAEKQGIEKEKMVQESMDVIQGKIVIGYDVETDEDMINDNNLKYIGMVYNGILGGSANSKLFQNVREMASLAYTTGSNYAYFCSNILVSAGIDINNFDKAMEIIKKQIEDMRNGDFSEEDISNVKKVIVSNIKSIDDEQDTEIIYYLGQILSGKIVTLEEYEKGVYAVTKEEIVNFAKNVKINTIYFLRN